MGRERGREGRREGEGYGGGGTHTHTHTQPQTHKQRCLVFIVPALPRQGSALDPRPRPTLPRPRRADGKAQVREFRSYREAAPRVATIDLHLHSVPSQTGGGPSPEAPNRSQHRMSHSPKPVTTSGYKPQSAPDQHGHYVEHITRRVKRGT